MTHWTDRPCCPRCGLISGHRYPCTDETQRTNGDWLRDTADKAGMSGRTLEQVTADLAACKARAKGKNAGLDMAMARLMLTQGRLQPAARAYVAAYIAGDK